MSSLVKITSSILPAIYPDITYQDKTYTAHRVIELPQIVDKVETDKRFETIDNAQFLNRTIQAVTYRRFQLRVFASESVNIAELKACGIVDITLKNDVIHRAEILDIAHENLEDILTRVFTIEYLDINLSNYAGVEPINNYLEKDVIREIHGDYSLGKLTIKANRTIDSTFTGYGNEYIFYTKLVSERADTSANIYQDNDTNSKLVQSIVKSRFTFRYYLNETDKNILEKYAKACDEIYIESGALTITSVEEIDIEINDKNLVDMYEVNVTITYNVEYTNYLESSVVASTDSGNISHVYYIGDPATYTFYTYLTPKDDVNIIESDNELGTGLNIREKQVSQDVIEGYFYLTESDKNGFLKTLNDEARYYDRTTYYNKIEVVEYNIEEVENAIDLYKVTIRLKHVNTETYPYES